MTRDPNHPDSRALQPATTSFKRRSGVSKNVAVMTLAAGLVATIALPAYAFSPDQEAAKAASGVDANLASAKLNGQNVVVAADAASISTTRDQYTATSEAELAAAKAAEQAAAAAAARQAAVTAQRQAAISAQTTQSKGYSGPSASDYLSNPAYPNFSLDQVVAVAKQYIGVPYQFGGATPAAFDCSGYTMFVYAQFGIKLPHSGGAQGRMGTRISTAAAQPGDVVIIDGGSHVAFYMGDGMMMDAPKPGGFVSIRPIYTTNYFIVRFGI